MTGHELTPEEVECREIAIAVHTGRIARCEEIIAEYKRVPEAHQRFDWFAAEIVRHTETIRTETILLAKYDDPVYF